MKLPAAPYFSDSLIAQETRPMEPLPLGLTQNPNPDTGSHWNKALFAGVLLGAAIAMTGFWLDIMG